MISNDWICVYICIYICMGGAVSSVQKPPTKCIFWTLLSVIQWNPTRADTAWHDLQTITFHVFWLTLNKYKYLDMPQKTDLIWQSGFIHQPSSTTYFMKMHRWIWLYNLLVCLDWDPTRGLEPPCCPGSKTLIMLSKKNIMHQLHPLWSALIRLTFLYSTSYTSPDSSRQHRVTASPQCASPCYLSFNTKVDWQGEITNDVGCCVNCCSAPKAHILCIILRNKKK